MSGNGSRQFADLLNADAFVPTVRAVAQHRRFKLGGPDKDSKKSKIVFVGGGWGCSAFLPIIDTSCYDVTLVSNTNHILFTPYLESSSTGVTYPSGIEEPLEPYLSREGRKVVEFLKGTATDVNLETDELLVDTADGVNGKSIPFDILVLAVGATTATANIPGAEEYTHKLKTAEDASAILSTLEGLFEKAAKEETDAAKRQLLHFAIVGGGPTGTEVCGRLLDLVRGPMAKKYPALKSFVQISLITRADTVLKTFSDKVRLFSNKKFLDQGVNLKLKTAVTKVDEDKTLHTKASCGTEEALRCGFVLWAPGIAPEPLAARLAAKLNDETRTSKRADGNRDSQDADKDTESSSGASKIEKPPSSKFPAVDGTMRAYGVPNKNVYIIGDSKVVKPIQLADHADGLWKMACESSKAAGAPTSNSHWIRDNPKIQFRFPQVHTVEGKALLKASKKLDEAAFKKLLKDLDESYTSPPANASSVVQEGAALAAALNDCDPTETELPVARVAFRGQMSYVGAGHCILDAPGMTMAGGFLAKTAWAAGHMKLRWDLKR